MVSNFSDEGVNGVDASDEMVPERDRSSLEELGSLEEESWLPGARVT